MNTKHIESNINSKHDVKLIVRGHPFSTYAVRGGGGGWRGKLLLISLCTTNKKLRTVGGGG